MSSPYTTGSSGGLHASNSTPSSVSGPLATSSYFNSTIDPTIGLKLWNNTSERDQHENAASLFAIIKATEALEKAFARDLIEKAPYKEECSKLISQFKTASKAAGVRDIKVWMEQNQLNCEAAYHRLVEKGVPETGESDASARVVVEITQYFITLNNALAMDMRAVDQIQPHVQSLFTALSQFATVPPTSPAKQKVQHWLVVINKMRAFDSLDDDQVRQMAMDINTAYEAFLQLMSEFSRFAS